VAAQTGLPLRILEPGASAGLNLLWDHYRYEVDGATWAIRVPRSAWLVASSRDGLHCTCVLRWPSAAAAISGRSMPAPRKGAAR
jgi:Uncharacterized protein conserved in bacteria (DUF2332)